jgi:surface antigen
MSKKLLASTSCRSVGCGGTTVDMYATPEGVECVWTNENCPYIYGDVTADDQYRASDRHNVSRISWEEMRALMAHAPQVQPNQKKGRLR